MRTFKVERTGIIINIKLSKTGLAYFVYHNTKKVGEIYPKDLLFKIENNEYIEIKN
jgi:hypothetical protein